MVFLQRRPFPYQMPSAVTVCSSSDDIALGVAIPRALRDPNTFIFSHAKHFEVPDSWGRYRNSFRMPNPVMLARSPVLDYKAHGFIGGQKEVELKLELINTGAVQY